MNKPKAKDKANVDFARSTNIAAQFVVFIGAGFGGGFWIDGKIGWRVPVCAIALAFFGLIAALYHIIKDTKPKDKDNDQKK